jgi:hypothetical protein
MASNANTKATNNTGAKASKPAATGAKVRWVVGQVHANGKSQAGLGYNGTAYAISRNSSGQYVATAKPAKGSQATLVTGSFSQAYWAAVNHNKAAVAKAAKAAAASAARKASKASAPAATAPAATPAPAPAS